jgi:anti-sigma regulatory factor (Ser/Thr protein kinase)
MTVVAPPRPGGRHDGYQHEAVFHDGIDAFVDVVRPWVEEGIDKGDPIVMLLTQRTTEALREGLDEAAQKVVFGDMGVAGRNPARIISVWRGLYAEHHRDGHDLRAIGEPVWPGRSCDELSECAHHEALLNPAFADCPDLWLWCPYDTRLLAPDVLAEARRNHPWIVLDGEREVSADYDEPGTLGAALDSPLPEPHGSVSELLIEEKTLRGLRHVVRCQARAAGLSDARGNGLVLAISELATNSIRHGGGSGRLRTWITDDGMLVHEVRDRGRIDDPLIGRTPPAGDALDGRGLWLVYELCDLVQMRSTPEEGTIVRTHMACG